MASAQLWTPLDTVPKPNAIIAHDTSVTMGITPGCTNCHNRGGSRLEVSKQDILRTLPLFEDYFTFGSFQYAGCDFAKIVQRVIPTPDTPEVSYAQVVSSIQSARACDSKEERLPAGDVTSCATPGCTGDAQLVADLVYLGLPGFDPMRPFLHENCTYDYVSDWTPCVTTADIICDPRDPQCPFPDQTCGAGPAPDVGYCSPSRPAPTDAIGWRNGCYHISCSEPAFSPDGVFFALGQLPGIQWPRWSTSEITPQQVVEEFCDPVREVLRDVFAAITACRPENALYLRNFEGVLNSSSWCNPGRIARNACRPGSPLYDTCVCDNSNPACITGGSAASACNTPLTWKARQQVAVCEAYEDGGAFDSYFTSQADNVVNGQCRENAVLFFTDGYMGHTPGTLTEAARAFANPTYRSAGNLSNMAVFRVANNFTDQANAMMRAVTNDAVPAAYSAVDEATMQESFSRLLNRIYDGVYTGASMTLDSQGTGAVFHSFMVPGYRQGGPISDDYLGWPARLSWHAVAPDGTIVADPTWETDWAAKVGRTPACGPTVLGVTDVDKLGPDGTFRNGVPRNISLGSIDRDGDGNADAHPQVRVGRMYSVATTSPVIVEAPREGSAGKYGTDFLDFQNDPQIRQRPRAVYTFGNGYLHGFFAGSYQTGGSYAGRNLAFSYDDDDQDNGAEILRYGPSWVRNQAGTDYRYNANDLIQQPLTTGQLVAKEVRIDTSGYNSGTSGYQFRTVLVGAQGKTGRGYFSMDVTNPCAPRLIREWLLPNGRDRASAEPMIYMFPTNGTEERAVVVTTGGLDGSATLYAHDLVSGNLRAQANLDLPGGGSYLAAPVCADARGEGHITHCWAVREDGRVVRVEVRPNAFGPAVDITPAGIVGGNRRFTTSPAVYFGPSGAINLVFGSGDFERLNEGGPQNYVYKITDRAVRKNAITGAADLETACAGGVSGRITLGQDERVISKPIIAKGIVAWTTYRPGTNACIAGQASLYAMNYDTCKDAVDGTGPPEPIPVSPGLPTSPTLHRDSQTLLVGTSAGPTAGQTTSADVLSRGGNRAWVKRVFWRLLQDAR